MKNYSKKSFVSLRLLLWGMLAFLGVFMLCIRESLDFKGIIQRKRKYLFSGALEEPLFFSKDEEGRAFWVGAEKAFQKNVGSNNIMVTFVQPVAKMKDFSGDQFTGAANKGVYFSLAKKLHLEGGVRLSTLSGYHMVTPSADCFLNGRHIYGKKLVKGGGPFGDFIGDSFEFFQEGLRSEFILKGRSSVKFF